MPFRIPGENDRLRDRINRSVQNRSESTQKTDSAISRKIERMREDEEFRKSCDRTAFEFYLMAGDFLRELEEQAERNRPKGPDDEWNEEFCQALHLLPIARDMVERASIGCIGTDIQV